MGEYFEELFRMPFLQPAALPITFFLIVLEIMLGVTCLFGIKMKWTSWLLLLMILFFSFLTFSSAFWGVVPECGCFGDFLKMTQWQSFGKNVVLLLLILPVFLQRRSIRPVFKPRQNNAVFTACLLLAVAFPAYCLHYLPIWDFRPYAVGSNLREQMKTVKAPTFSDPYFVYKNKTTNEEGKYFIVKTDAKGVPDLADSLSKIKLGYKVMPWRSNPHDSLWRVNNEFVKTNQDKLDDGIPAKITDFIPTDENGRSVTDSLLNLKKPALWLILYDVQSAKASSVKTLASLGREAEKNGYAVFGFSSNEKRTLDEFRQSHNLSFPFFTCDSKVLQTMVRSNPGLLLVKDGIVLDMWSKNNLPDPAALFRSHGK